MRSLSFILSVLTSITVFAGALDELKFMQGCWTSIDNSGQKITEDWQKSSNETMLGISQTTNPDGSLEEYEFLEIKFDETTKKVSYTPFLNGKKLNTFWLEPNPKPSATAIFADPTNTTLKKLEYSLKSSETLNIRLIGNSKKGTPFDFNFDMKKDDCKTRY
jgi:hypothetical protein